MQNLIMRRRNADQACLSRAVNLISRITGYFAVFKVCNVCDNLPCDKSPSQWMRLPMLPVRHQTCPHHCHDAGLRSWIGFLSPLAHTSSMGDGHGLPFIIVSWTPRPSNNLYTLSGGCCCCPWLLVVFVVFAVDWRHQICKDSWHQAEVGGSPQLKLMPLISKRPSV